MKSTLLKRTSSAFGVAALIVAASLAVPVPQVGAQSSQVEANIDNQTALLYASQAGDTTLPAPNDTVQTATAVTKIRGTVNALLQMRVYVDDLYNATVPLTQNDTSFEYDLELQPGLHTIRLDGVSANSSPDPTYTFKINYVPNIATPSTPVITGDAEKQGGVTIDSSANPTIPNDDSAVRIELPPWLYSTFVALDIAAPTNSGATIQFGFWRVFFVILGVLFVTLAPWVLAAYRNVRYNWLGWHGKPVAAPFRKHPIAWIRVIGAILLIGSLLLI